MNRIVLLMSCIVFFGSCNNSTKSNENSDSTKESTAEEVSENSDEITTKEVTYEANGVIMKGYMAIPAGATADEPVPGIMIAHEWWGHTDYVRERAEQVAKEWGYAALALDMYGDGKTAKHPEDASSFAGEVMGNFDGAKQRFLAAHKLLTSRPEVNGESIGAMGYCFGGSVIISMGLEGLPLKGIAAYHAGLQLPVQVEKDKATASFLIMNGGADPFVPEEQVNNFKEMMDNAEISYTYISFPDALHAYSNPGATEKGEKFDLPLKYDKQADEDSWQMTKMFFAEKL